MDRVGSCMQEEDRAQAVGAVSEWGRGVDRVEAVVLVDMPWGILAVVVLGSKAPVVLVGAAMAAVAVEDSV